MNILQLYQSLTHFYQVAGSLFPATRGCHMPPPIAEHQERHQGPELCNLNALNRATPAGRARRASALARVRARATCGAIPRGRISGDRHQERWQRPPSGAMAAACARAHMRAPMHTHAQKKYFYYYYLLYGVPHFVSHFVSLSVSWYGRKPFVAGLFAVS